MQLLGKLDGAEINSIATNPLAAPTSFITATDKGFITYWDTRLKKRDVLTTRVPNSAGCDDILEVVWGSGSSSAASAEGGGGADVNKAYCIAGSVISCVDVRKASVLAQDFVSNAYRVKKAGGAAAAGGGGEFVMKSVPVDLACFDASLKQHPLCNLNNSTAAASSSASSPPLMSVMDDNGEVYVVDPSTCKVVNSYYSNTNTTTTAATPAPLTYNGVLRPAARQTVSCGFTTFSNALRSDNVEDSDKGSDRRASVAARTTVTCLMDQHVLCYRNSAAAAAAVVEGSSSSSQSFYQSLKGSKLVGAINLENLGGEAEEGGASSTTNNNNAVTAAKSAKQRKDIANPPIPACFAPLTVPTDGKDVSLLTNTLPTTTYMAVGRGDGSFVVLEHALPADATAPANGVVGADALASYMPEVALVAQGHAHNTIGTCLWMPPTALSAAMAASSPFYAACGGGGGANPSVLALIDSAVAERYNSDGLVPKVLITVPTAGDIIMWDVTRCVAPLTTSRDDEGEDADEAEDADEVEPTPLFSANIRGAGLAGPRSMANCASLTGNARGLLVGTSSGEVLMEMFE